jgi:DNA-binding NarL/FixJ family response regulator
MTDQAGRVTVLIVDDHEVVRRGVAALLEGEGFVVVGDEPDTTRALATARRTRPDVVLMDVRMDGESGIEGCREIRAALPDTAVIMLTSFADEQALFASILAGASGFVLKQVQGDDIVRAVREAAAGRSLLDPGMTASVLQRLRTRKDLFVDERLGKLSPQEERILALIADGKTNREIGDDLRLAEKTIKNYVSSIFLKLGVSRRAEAASYLERHRPPET